MIVDSILDAVGCTPLVRLGRLSSGNVFAKLAGSRAWVHLVAEHPGSAGLASVGDNQ